MKTTANALIVHFITIAYAFTWLAWLPSLLASAGLIPEIPWLPLFVIGIFGPMVAAFWCLHQEGGWPAVKDWLRRGFARRITWRWWLFILLTPFIIPLLALLIYKGFGGMLLTPMILQQPWIFIPTILLMVTIGGGQEEYGWRGYLLPKLDARWQPWQADLLMVIVHTFWHPPLFFISDTSQSQYPFWLFLAFGLGFTPLINRVFRHTGGSILAVILFHGLVNAGLEIFPPVGVTVNYSVVPLLLVGVMFGLLAVFAPQKELYPDHRHRLSCSAR